MREGDLATAVANGSLYRRPATRKPSMAAPVLVAAFCLVLLLGFVVVGVVLRSEEPDKVIKVYDKKEMKTAFQTNFCGTFNSSLPVSLPLVFRASGGNFTASMQAS